MNIFNNHNYGDNYVVQAGATVIAGGAKAAMQREQMMREQMMKDQEAAASSASENSAESAEAVASSASSVSSEDLEGSSIARWQEKSREERIGLAIQQMRQEQCPGKNTCFLGEGTGYQFAYILALMMNQGEPFDLPKMEGVQEFIDYLRIYVHVSDLPSYDTINRRLGIIGGIYPNWRLSGKKYNDELEAKSVAQRFLSIYLKGI